MKLKNIYNVLLALALGFMTSFSANAQSFSTITTDPTGDGSNPMWLDGTLLEYSYNPTSDSITFRVSVTNLAQNVTALGVNIMVNIPNSSSPTFTFWGNDNKNAYHRFVTAWVTGQPPANYTGTLGIADGTGVNASNYTNIGSNNIAVSVAPSSNQITLAMKRSDLIPDSYFGSSNSITCVTAAAVGSNQGWNDDIYSANGTMTITKNFPSSTKNVRKQNAKTLSIYPNPSNGNVNISFDNEYKNADIIVFNSLGQLIKSISNVSGKYYSLQTTAFVPGSYFVKVLQDDQIYTSQFIINK